MKCENPMFEMRLPPDVSEKYLRNPAMQHFMLVSAGHRGVNNTVGHCVKRYSAAEYCLIYCTKGRGWLQNDRKRWTISPGDVFFCFKDSLHFYGADINEPWEIYWSYFLGDDTPFRLQQYGVSEDNPVYSIGYNSKIIALFSNILEILKRGHALRHLLYASDFLLHIINSICFITMYEEKQLEESVIEDTITFMLENLNNSLSLETLSSRISMSSSRFGKYFQDEIGHPPIDYFIGLKIQKACTLIKTTNMTIKEISHSLGYQDVYYFSRLFKKKTQSSPRQYRKQSLL